MKLSNHDMAELSKVFAPLLEWLDVDVYKKNPKLGFNMKVYHDQIQPIDFRGKYCNEIVCVLGFLWKHHGFETHRDYGHAIIEDIIEKFDFEDVDTVRTVLLRLSMAVIDDENGNPIVSHSSDIRPYQAAAAIRYFLKTGKVKWNKFIDYGQISGG